jgi:hypothetical protein
MSKRKGKDSCEETLRTNPSFARSVRLERLGMIVVGTPTPPAMEGLSGDQCELHGLERSEQKRRLVRGGSVSAAKGNNHGVTLIPNHHPTPPTRITKLIVTRH